MGKWYSSSCDSDKKSFVGELPPSYEDDCVNNYDGFCYTHWPAANFQAAQENCEKNCGTLVTIHSANENRYLSSLFFQSADSGDLLIGATRTAKYTFSWFDGSFWSFDNFDTTVSIDDNCVAMGFGTSNKVAPGSWHTVSCSDSFEYMCKRPAGTNCPPNQPLVTVTPIPSNPSTCNAGILIAPEVISSHNYPYSYDSNTNCTFTDFRTEENYDVVSVYDGDSTNADLLGTFSGNHFPFSVVSSGNNLLVTFTSNNATNNAGFSASFSGYVYHL
ncbi:hypothetical protein L5515_015613 [Caenorhabditis briggsae]|uniref:CUB domain-containing protein n=1 Tax=Caenorhabditis briggsae TaxID=6238 RepID=A0AAE9JAD7_CAEBR|nr:hypothetical protein L5515_015613 [Caenorhabditis briggsae]